MASEGGDPGFGMSDKQLLTGTTRQQKGWAAKQST